MKRIAFLSVLAAFILAAAPLFSQVKKLDVDFKFTPTAAEAAKIKEVYLAGQFQGWKPKDPKWKMKKEADGSYTYKVTLLKGKYQYKYVINGTDWTTPPEATMKMDDGFGGKNGIKTVTDKK